MIRFALLSAVLGLTALACVVESTPPPAQTPVQPAQTSAPAAAPPPVSSAPPPAPVLH